jgi:prepilin-type N-terminal cleavage/methylation domain-containing protein
MKYARSQANSRGFTLIELTISLAILSILVLVGIFTFIAVIRQQQAIISIRTTNQVSRVAINDISAEARLGYRTQVIIDGMGYQQLCIYESSRMVQYYVADITNGRSTLYRTNKGAGETCMAMPNNDTSHRPVTSADTDIASFEVWRGITSVAPVAYTNPEHITVKIGVVTDRTLMTNGVCNEGSATYCALSKLETSIGLQGDSGIAGP